MADVTLQPQDLPDTLSALGRLSALLTCSGCQGPPGDDCALLRPCHHALCRSCFGGPRWSGGRCPVDGCFGVSGAADFEPDLYRMRRWKAVQAMKRALAPSQSRDSEPSDVRERGQGVEPELAVRGDLPKRTQTEGPDQGYNVQPRRVRGDQQKRRTTTGHDCRDGVQPQTIPDVTQKRKTEDHDPREGVQPESVEDDLSQGKKTEGHDHDKSVQHDRLRDDLQKHKNTNGHACVEGVRPESVQGSTEERTIEGRDRVNGVRPGGIQGDAKKRGKAVSHGRRKGVQSENGRDDFKRRRVQDVDRGKNKQKDGVQDDQKEHKILDGDDGRNAIRPESSRNEEASPGLAGSAEASEPSLVTTSKSSVRMNIKPAGGKGTAKNRNVNRKNVRGETPLQVACIKGDTERVRSLLDDGAVPNTQDHAGWTPLHEASQRGFDGIVELLLKHGANPNVPGGQEHVTPLHDAVSAGHAKAVELLLRFGAKRDVTNSDGRSARDLTADPKLIQVLEQTPCCLSESQQLEISFMNYTNALQSKALVIYCHLLSAPKTSLVKSRAKSLACKVVSSITEEVTHVLFDCEGSLVLENSHDVYYEALLMGKCLVELSWFFREDEEALPDEGDFMLKGLKSKVEGAPKKAFTNAVQQLPRLLDGYHVFLHGTFSHPYPRKGQLIRILRSGGATVLSREPDPELIPDGEQKIPYHAPKSGPMSTCSHVIMYQESSSSEPLLKYDMRHLKSLPAAWLFDSINNFAIADSAKYKSNV